MILDAINAIFPFVGGMITWASILKLHKHKQVRGVSLWAVSFFAFYSMWNIVFYSHLGQWWSLAAGILMVISNTTQAALTFHYHFKEKRECGGCELQSEDKPNVVLLV